jgi:Uma2 family endonuclease
MPSTFSLKTEPETRNVLWTRQALQFLIEGNLIEGEKYELFEGNLHEKMKNRRHIIAQRRLLQAFLLYYAAEYLQSEAPIDVAPADNETSAPEPDLALLNRSDEDFLTSAPQPSDISLVIEIADSTLRRDLGAKAKRYAKAEIPEYWVIDIENRQVHVHQNPQPETETWGSITIFAEAETIAPLVKPTAAIAIGDILPPV